MLAIKKKTKLIFAFAAPMICLSLPIFLSLETQAYNYKYGVNTTLDKIMYKNALTATQAFNDDLTIGNLKTYTETKYIPIDKDFNCDVPIPNTILAGSTEASPVLSCYKFVTGKEQDNNSYDKKYKNDWSGIMKTNLSSESTNLQFGEYLIQIGYAKTENGQVTNNCIHATVHRSQSINGDMDYLDREIDNYICSEVYEGVMGTIKTIDNTSGTGYQFVLDDLHPGYNVSIGVNYNTGYGLSILTVPTKIDTGVTKWDDFVAGVKSAADGYSSGNAGNSDTAWFSISRSSTPANEEDISGTEYKLTDRFKLAKSIIGDTAEDAATSFLSTAEVYNIYAKYLKGSTVRLSCGNSGFSDSSYNWMPVKIKKDDEIADNCYVREINDMKYTGAQDYSRSEKDGQFYFTRRNMSLSDIVAQINSFDLESIIDDLVNIEDVEAMEEDNPEEDSEEADCLSSGAAENLGWIICPVLSFASEQAQNLYSDLIEPALQIEPSLFGGDNTEESNTYKAWTIFQGFANTVFIIFFLFVIFSQVTGVGIDNYGIKKIMPKLIIAAILVNLSYVICQVCVDLSNIIGNGIQAIFNDLASNVTINATIGGKNVGEQIGSTMISAAGIAAAAYVAYITVAVWILPLLVAVIGAIISIIFLFVLLAGREALIVLLTVISPLAFVCYLLPNTKKLFDKYVKIGEVLLLLYPICGLVVAGGGYVSKLLLAIPQGELDSDLFYTFTAMIISIVPIFFIPKLVKSSFGALGSVGATLSGLGARLGGRAKSGISKSGTYKAGQERLAEAQTKWRAGIGADGKPIDMTLGQRFMRGSFSNRGIARNRVQALKDQDVRDRADRLSSGIGFEAAQIAQQKAAEADQVKDYMTYINSKTNNGENEEALYDLFGQYTTKGQENKFGAIAVARIAGRRKDTADNFVSNHFIEDKDHHHDYSKGMMDTLAKEIATGENSGNYMAAAPIKFEYASQLNKGKTTTANYDAWKGETENGSYSNIHSALQNYVTTPKQLVGLKSSSLKEIRDLATEGNMDANDIKRISELADLTESNKDKYTEYDTTKGALFNDLIGLRKVKAKVRRVNPGNNA